MQTLNEWLKDKNIGELSQGFGAIVYHDRELTETQLEQIVLRIEGLVHGFDEETKSLLIDKLMRSVEERILGL